MTTSPTANRVLVALGQVGRTIAACLAVVASLVVFPNAIPWLIAAWLAVYTLLVVSGHRRNLCLIGCLGVLLLKRLTPAPGLLGLTAVMSMIAILSVLRNRRQEPSGSRRFASLSTIVLWIAWASMTVDWYASMHCRHPVVLRADRPVVCFGDSMTSLGLFGGYPSDLEGLISLPVVNLGIGGISAKDTVEDHMAEITRLSPQVVVIELGGHDFLRGHGRAATKARLKTIIEAVRQIGAEVVLMEIPRDYLSDPFWGLERELARQEDIELVPDTALRTIFLRSTAFPPGCWLGEPYLTDETGIHPNERGNQLLAESVAGALERMYGPGIRKP
jgi:acyl-CoA thioesterase I